MSAGKLTAAQQADVTGARAFLAAARQDGDALAAHIGMDGSDRAMIYARALGRAQVTIDGLLDIIDSLTGGAA